MKYFHNKNLLQWNLLQFTKSDMMWHTNVMFHVTRYNLTDKLLCVEVQEIWATASKHDHDKNTMIKNHKHQLCMHLWQHVATLGGWGQEVSPLPWYGSFLLNRPCLSSPGINLPINTEQGQISSSLPQDIAMWMGKICPKRPIWIWPCLEAMHVPNYVKISC